MPHSRFAALVVTVGLVALAADAVAADSGGVAVPLGGIGFDIEHDVARGVLYASIPSLNEIAVISTASYAVVDRIVVGSIPMGIDLSSDGSRLFVALGGSGAVAIVDLGSKTVSELVVGERLGDANTYDVIEAQPNRLFVSTNRIGSGPAWIVEVELDNGNRATRVANNRNIGTRPLFDVSPDERFLYVGEGPANRLYKLDLTRDTAPIVLEAASGSVALISSFKVSPDGTRIATAFGQVLSTSSFQEVGRVPAGVPSYGATHLYYARTPGQVVQYDAETLASVGATTLPCSVNRIDRLLVLPGDSGLLIIGGDLICGAIPNLVCTSPPAIPDRPAPVDAATAVPARVSLRWAEAGAGCQSRYDVQLDGSDLPARQICDGVSDTLCDPGVLEPDRTYHWQVTAHNEAGTTAGPIWSFATGSFKPTSYLPIEAALPDTGFDMVVDEERRLVYVSIPTRNQIRVISAQSYELVEIFDFRAQPLGIDLSLDRTRLFVALSGIGAVGVVDLQTGEISEIDILDALGDRRTFDVIEAQPGRLFASTNPGSNGPGYIVEVRLDQGNAVRRVASNELIDTTPIMAVNPEHGRLYVGEAFGSLVALDLDLPEAPIVLEDGNHTVTGTDYVEVSPDGSQIYLREGQVLRAASFLQAGRAGAGVPRFGESQDTVYYADEPNSIQAFDTRTFVKLDEHELPCTLATIRRLEVLPDESGWLVLGGNLLCGLSDDVDLDGVRNSDDNCPVSANSDQLDTDHDTLGDACDNCPVIANEDQANLDVDELGDVCDPYPAIAFRVQPTHAGSALAGEAVSVTYDLVERRDGRLLSDLTGIRMTLTLGGSARFGNGVRDGVLVDGGGTNRALVEFVQGRVTLEVGDPIAELATLSGEDTDGVGIEFLPGVIESFEQGDGGFRHLGPNDAWEWGAPTSGPHGAFSGSRVWATNLDSSYPNNTDSQLVSPMFELSEVSRPVLRFVDWFDSEPRDDEGFVEISTNRGASWAPLDSFSGFVGGYSKRSYDLEDYAGSEIQIRFRLASDSSTFRAGWYIDDFALEGVGGSIEFLAFDGDADGDGLTSGAERSLGTDPRKSDSDFDGVLDGDDNCPLAHNTDQLDLVHPNATGDACEDPDGDGVSDFFDNCTDESNPDQENADGDRAGDACDAHPEAVLFVRPQDFKYALTGVPVLRTYQLVDRRDGSLLEHLSGIRVTLTLDGSAVFGDSAHRGLLLDGAGTNRALVEFVDGVVELEIRDDVRELVTLGGEDTEGIDLDFAANVFEDFELDDGGFTHTGANDPWQWGRPTSGPESAHSGQRVWATNLEGNYLDDTNAALISPNFWVPSSGMPSLRLWKWYATQSSNFDRVSLDISRDGGATWTLLQRFSGDERRYRFDSYSLAAYLGARIQVRFLFISNNSLTGPGWYFDDFELTGLNTRVEFLAPEVDLDGDGLTNSQELVLGTDPRVRDTDVDGAFDGVDNCPTVKNADQSDAVHPNGRGDACDDPDADGVVDLIDNCADSANPDQRDVVHQNGVGDACDDPDSDGVTDASDNCASLENSDQLDLDADDVGDACDICNEIFNPDQSESIACVEISEADELCREAEVAPVGELAIGEILVSRLDVSSPEALWFDVTTGSCGESEPIEFSLNGVFLGSEMLNPEDLCGCWVLERLAVAEGDLLANAWNPDGDNRFAIEKPGKESFVSMVVGVAQVGDRVERACLFDASGSECRGFDHCYGSTSDAPLSIVTRVTELFVARSPVRVVTFPGGVLPGSFDIGMLPDGVSEVCVAPDPAPALLGSNSDGELFVVDAQSGAGTLRGSLEAAITEIEYDPATGRGFAQRGFGILSGFEFDFRNLGILKPDISTGARFNGLEYVGSELYGTATFETDGPSELRILSLPSGDSTLIGPTGRGPIAGLAYDDSSRTLYGIDGGPGPAELLQIDPTTGLATPIGPTGFQAGSLEFGPGGVLYGGGTGRDAGKLYRIDPGSGLSELVGMTGFGSTTGLAFVESIADRDCDRFIAHDEQTLAINGAACVEIDIRPGSEENRIQLTSAGVIPVAILGSEDFDVRDVDAASLRFCRDAAPPMNDRGEHFDDVNDDRFDDLVSQFRTEDAGIAFGDTRACMSGATRDGISFESCDAITTLGARRGAIRTGASD